MKLKCKLFGKVVEFSVTSSRYYLWQVHKLNQSGKLNELLCSNLSMSRGEAVRRARAAAEHWVRAENDPVQWAVYSFPEYRLVKGRNLNVEVSYSIRETELLK